MSVCVCVFVLFFTVVLLIGSEIVKAKTVLFISGNETEGAQRPPSKIRAV